MKKLLVLLIASLSIFLVSCQDKNRTEVVPDVKGDQKKITVSNMADESSIKEVESALKAYLQEQSVDDFIKGVADYNQTVENKSLIGSFEEKEQPIYDMEAISKLWTSKKGDFIGTNCRLNTFTLLKGNIEIQKGHIDDSLLFLDESAILTGNLFEKEDEERFKRLFSKVKTENTKDIRIHAEKMKEHFSNIKFDEGAKMISVVIHDNLDGDFLFVGHVGVLVKEKGEYLFVEKLSFEEPFQAVKFKTKEDCFKYLFLKYKHYQDETTAKPFLMENDEFIELDLYDKE